MQMGRKRITKGMRHALLPLFGLVITMLSQAGCADPGPMIGSAEISGNNLRVKVFAGILDEHGFESVALVRYSCPKREIGKYLYGPYLPPNAPISLHATLLDRISTRNSARNEGRRLSSWARRSGSRVCCVPGR